MYEGQLGGSVRGVIGVMTYYIQEINETLAVMFRVPMVGYNNWWNVKLYKGEQESTKSIYDEMFQIRNDPLKGNDAWRHRYLNSNDTIKMRGAMASSGKTTLQIKVMRKVPQIQLYTSLLLTKVCLCPLSKILKIKMVISMRIRDVSDRSVL